MEKPNYSVIRHCSNCGYSNDVVIEKGTMASDSVVCSNCGCDTSPPRWIEKVGECFEKN